jgi:hypothetical protein
MFIIIPVAWETSNFGAIEPNKYSGSREKRKPASYSLCMLSRDFNMSIKH